MHASASQATRTSRHNVTKPLTDCMLILSGVLSGAMRPDVFIECCSIARAHELVPKPEVVGGTLVSFDEVCQLSCSTLGQLPLTSDK